MSRSAKIYIHNNFAGLLRQNEDGYSFTYDASYLNSGNLTPVSLSFPVRKEPYHGHSIFPFFDGLIPEGWFLEMATEDRKLNPRDRMGLLLLLCTDCIGAVSIVPAEEAQYE